MRILSQKYVFDEEIVAFRIISLVMLDGRSPADIQAVAIRVAQSDAQPSSWTLCFTGGMQLALMFMRNVK